MNLRKKNSNKLLLIIQNENRKKIIYELKNDPRWKNQFIFVDYKKNQEPSWFGLPLIINKNIIEKEGGSW